MNLFYWKNFSKQFQKWPEKWPKKQPKKWPESIELPPQAPIDCWIKMMEGDIEYSALRKEDVDRNVASVVPSVLEFIATNEAHPEMNDSNRVDYKAIYEALAQVTVCMTLI